MTSDPKLTPDHRRRRAVISLHISSEGQVVEDQVPRQHRQYALADRVRGLDFCDVNMLDVDLGPSGAVAAKRWTRFERLLGPAGRGPHGGDRAGAQDDHTVITQMAPALIAVGARRGVCRGGRR